MPPAPARRERARNGTGARDEGGAFFEQAKFDEALAAYRAAVEKDPEMSAAWFRIGVVEMAKNGKQPCEAAAGRSSAASSSTRTTRARHCDRQRAAARAQGLRPRRGAPPRVDRAQPKTCARSPGPRPRPRFCEATCVARSARCRVRQNIGRPRRQRLVHTPPRFSRRRRPAAARRSPTRKRRRGFPRRSSRPRRGARVTSCD